MNKRRSTRTGFGIALFLLGWIGRYYDLLQIIGDISSFEGYISSMTPTSWNLIYFFMALIGLAVIVSANLDPIKSGFNNAKVRFVRYRSDFQPLITAINYIITSTTLGHGKVNSQVFEMIRKHALERRITIRGFLWNSFYVTPQKPIANPYPDHHKVTMTPEATEKSEIPRDALEESVFVQHGPDKRWAVKVEYNAMVHSGTPEMVAESGRVYFDPEVSMQQIRSVFEDKG